ncbi:MAG: hypothetical protein QMD02_08300, partial [Bacteroidales bacterium]|nr:hypothetical protein [Bacteroidales bacterium]
LGFTNSLAKARSNSVNPSTQHGLLVLLQIISQCGISIAYELLQRYFFNTKNQKRLYYLNDYFNNYYFSNFINKLIKYDKTRYCYHTY